MSVVLITYDVNLPGDKRDKLLNYIKSFQEWGRLSESCYAVHSIRWTADDVYNHAMKFLDRNDTLVTATLKEPCSGQTPDGTIVWLKRALGR